MQHLIIHNKYRIGRSDNGWIDNEHCLEWISQSFIPQTAACNTTGKPILLIWDGHRSHCTSILLLKAYEHDILILRLLPHCTHKLQPLDVRVFGLLQAKFADVTDEFVGKHYCRIHKSDFVSVYMKAQEKAISSELIKSAFRHCGIHPLNVDIFDTESFAPNQATSTVSSAHLPNSFPTSPISPSEEGEKLEEWDHASAGYSSSDSEFYHNMIQVINSATIHGTLSWYDLSSFLFHL